MKFAKKMRSCKGCKAPISSGAVCKNCQQRLPDLLWHQQQEVRILQRDFHELWSQCQRCQGALVSDVICKNRDCPIFYRRTKCRRELIGALEDLAEFDAEAQR
ncbi:MAG: hypothetical protein MHM6MM_009227 [Cercozoa sp. M6MM]